MALTKGKFVLFAAAAIMLSVLLTLLGALAADLYLHHRAERSAGLNRWGYRGPIVGRKAPGGIRVAMLGGSTAFGYGVTWDEAIPAQLERVLNEHSSAPPTGVVNLGYNNEGSYAFLATLQDFEFLDADIAVFYEGYNDLGGDSAVNRAVFRHESAVFRLTGYFPILPLALVEKARSLRFGGDLDAAYAAARNEPGSKTVFRPNLAARTSASALEAADAVSNSLSRQLDRMAATSQAPVASTTEAGCAYPWAHYCQSIYVATRYALARDKVVAIVAQPRKVAEDKAIHDSQQVALRGMVGRHFANDARVRYVDLRDTVDLRNRDIAFDGMHLNAEGNGSVARALAPAVRELAAALRSSASR
jgi:lysophospholipase L1-like esterase